MARMMSCRGRRRMLTLAENMPWLSLNVSVAGEDIDETGYNKDQNSLGRWRTDNKTMDGTRGA